MNLKRTITGFFLTVGLLSGHEVLAQRTYEEMEQLTVNEQVTTVITASEPIRFVDISTEKIAGIERYLPVPSGRTVLAVQHTVWHIRYHRIYTLVRKLFHPFETILIIYDVDLQHTVLLLFVR